MNPRFRVARFLGRETKLFTPLAIFAGLTIAGCAGTNVTPGPSVASGAASQAAASVPGAMHPAAATLHVKDNASYKRALYVLNSSANMVQILTNTYYRQLGAITYGISNPKGETVDRQGNLYVTNQNYPYSDVAEFAPGANSPKFTYNAYYPEGVAVDRHGNVFVGDYFGTVRQYAQGVKNAIASCTVSGNVFGVAVDKNGNVFAWSEVGDNGPTLIELTGGVSSCNKTNLISFQYDFPMQPSLVLDANNNLIFPWGSNVNVVAPPYSSVTRTISGFSNVSGISLNKKNKLAYVSDSGTNTVTVIDYQTGTVVKQIGVGNGITQANGAVDAPNAVY